MSHSCPTVKIKTDVTEENPHGYIIINESDFDEEKHERFDEEKAPKEPKAPKAKKPEAMNVADLKAALDAKGVAYDASATKEELLELLAAGQE